MSDVHVKRLRIAVRATDASTGIEALREGERVLPEVLQQLGDELGDELVVLGKVELSLLLRKLGGGSFGPALRDELRTFLRAIVARARAERTTSANAAWYASEAEGRAAYLAAVFRGCAGSFPFTAFSDWGTTLEDAWRACLERGPRFVADVAAALARDDFGAFGGAPAAVLPGVLRALEARAAEFRDVVLGELPDDVLERLRAAWHGLPAEWSREQRLVSLLALLFESWPPARGTGVSAEELAAKLERSPAEERRVSSAGGLVFWSASFARMKLELDAAYPERRLAGAVRWALGRALEAATVPPGDALLLLFAGERPGQAARFSQALEEADPEPLHALALAFAERSGYLDGEFRLVPLGDERALVSGSGIVCDTREATDPHSVIPWFVRNLARRAPRVQPALELAEELDSATLDAIAEIDAVNAPERWRPALRALASVLRHWLRVEYRAALRDVRGWPAIQSSHPPRIELRRRDVNRIGEGRWLRDEAVSLWDAPYSIELV